MKSKSGERASSLRRERAARDLPEFAVSLFLVLLIWLFAELIFLPLSAESFMGDLSGRVTSIIAVAFVLAIGYLLPETVKKGDAAVKLLSSMLVKAWYPGARKAKMQRVFESLGRALLSVVLGVVNSSILYWIHPLFGGMALLSTIIIASIFTLQAANQASEEIVRRVIH